MADSEVIGASRGDPDNWADLERDILSAPSDTGMPYNPLIIPQLSSWKIFFFISRLFVPLLIPLSGR